MIKQNDKIEGTTEAWESRKLGADEEFVEVVKSNAIDEAKKLISDAKYIRYAAISDVINNIIEYAELLTQENTDLKKACNVGDAAFSKKYENL